MDIVSLLLFLLIVALAFFKKMNAGTLAFAVEVIAVRIFNLSDGLPRTGTCSRSFLGVSGSSSSMGQLQK